MSTSEAEGAAAHPEGSGGDRGTRSVWWAPGAIGWWIGVLFIVGSACFAAGSVPGFVDLVGAAAVGWTFFVGSIIFTSAGLLQYLATANPGPVAGLGPSSRFRFVFWEPARRDWWASVVQLAGTVFFNLSTYFALQTTWTAAEANRLIWRPDVYGSVCFLVASGLAWSTVAHRRIAWRGRGIAWWVAALNLAGSVAFGFSAVASKIVPESGDPRNVAVVNLGTFVGAVCFLAGACLLLVQRAEPAA